MEKIRSLQAKSVRGLWALALFLCISIGALRDFSFLPSMPEKLRKMLGHPPSPNMISGLLVIYSFSAIILILSRMMSDSESSGTMRNVAYLTAFYFFYHLSGSLDDNYWAVFASGLTILVLESYHSWIRCMGQIREEQEVLRKLDDNDKT